MDIVNDREDSLITRLVDVLIETYVWKFTLFVCLQNRK